MSEPRSVDPATEERIREALLDSDPARGDEGLSSREVERLRQTMLEEAGRSGSPTLRALLAAAAGILLVLGGAWIFWFRDAPERAGAVTVEAPPAPTGTLVPEDLDERPAADGVVIPADGEEIPKPAVAGPRPSTRMAERGGPSDSALETTGISKVPREMEAEAATDDRGALDPGDEQVSTAEAVVAREIRFETEGGTRLIWIFEEDPSVESDKGVTS